ncbi:MAG: hypothetical protein HYU66_01670 [Armatimonadetes bacterium]|nr:hypothetical protein [Armatimonadota bacterium]
MPLSQRSGLSLLGAGSDTVPAAHYNQNVKARIALAKVAAELFGGPGIYAGGAHELDDFGGSGTLYPAVTLVVNDDAGEAWFFKCAGQVAITFGAANASPAALYAVVQAMAGVSPAAAEGGATQVLFVAQDAADPAPPHALLLGTGAVSDSAFTSWTPEPGSFIAWPPGGGTVQDCTVRLDPEYPGVAWDDPGAVVTCEPGAAHTYNVYVIAEDGNAQAQVLFRVPDNFSAWKTTGIGPVTAASGTAPDSTVTLYIDGTEIDTYTLASGGSLAETAIPDTDLVTATAGTIMALYFDLFGCYSGYGSNVFTLAWIKFYMEVTT